MPPRKRPFRKHLPGLGRATGQEGTREGARENVVQQLHAAQGPRLAKAAPLPTHEQPPATPVTALQRLNTSRLLPARYSDSVLTRIADSPEDLQLIYALDNASNERLLAEADLRIGIRARELVFDVPYARIINAAFAHPHPQGARFSTPLRGAWYAAFELQTAKAEVLFHRSVQLAEIGWLQPEVLEYDHYYADFTGSFHDLRNDLRHDLRHDQRHGQPNAGGAAESRRQACLDPDSYVASQRLAAELLECGSLGVVYPSTRRAGGTCLACFRPSVVSNVRKRDLHRLTWYPEAPPSFPRVARGTEPPAKGLSPRPPG